MFALLGHPLRRLRSSIKSIGVFQEYLDPERDEAEKGTFTVGNVSPEPTVVSALTLSSARADDAEWIATYCRAYNICLAEAAEPRSPGTDSG